MKHKPWNIFFHELIGLRVRVLRSLIPSHEGLEGTVLFEGERSLVLEVGGRRVTVLKPGSRFLFWLPSGEAVEVEGDSILGDPAERTKRLKRGRRR